MSFNKIKGNFSKDVQQTNNRAGIETQAYVNFKSVVLHHCVCSILSDKKLIFLGRVILNCYDVNLMCTSSLP